MKSTFLSLSMLIAFSAIAQIFPVVSSDFTQPIPGPYNHFILDSANTLWQIGHSAKFDGVMSTKPALYTDTANAYPINANASVTMIMYDGYPGYGPYNGYELSFSSRYLTDSARDGGYIEMSVDSGVTWVNILDYDSVPFPYPDGFFQFYFGGKDIKLANGQRSSYTGHGTVYFTSYFSILFFRAIKARPEVGTADPVYLRFTFVSDSIETNKPGWQINEFEIYGGYASGLKEELHPVFISPNPSNGVFKIQSQNHTRAEYRVTDSLGRIILDGKMEGTTGWIDLCNHPAGVYTLRFYDGLSIKIVKQ